MANKSIFGSGGMAWISRNEAGGSAYNLGPRAALAQLASTSCLNNTLYVSAEKQLADVFNLANKVEPKYLAQVAVYSREKYHMKDIPALLCTVLAANKQTELLNKVFYRVINNGDMLRNFWQMLRSGQAGRHNFGSAPRRLITNWFNSRTPSEVFDQSVGTPSMRDILRLIRPRPLDQTRSAIYAWLVDRPYDIELLPEKVQQFEQWKNGVTQELPSVPFQMLTNRTLTTEQWVTIARRAGWKWLLKNLNTMQRQGVFNQEGMVDFVAQRLRDRKSILNARAFPYQILTAYQNATDVPGNLRLALHDALEVATENVPVLPEQKGGNPPVYLFVDVSGSMKDPVTGRHWSGDYRATTSMRRADVAALIACCMLRKNPGSQLFPFNKEVVALDVNVKETIMQNATKIAAYANGGTACSAPLKLINDQELHGDLIMIVSDNQSWIESMNIDRYGYRQSGKTALQTEWERWKLHNPQAKMVCVDVSPCTTTQVQERLDILNIGGWSDTVFELTGSFAAGTMSPYHLVGIIEGIDLDGDSLHLEGETENES